MGTSWSGVCSDTKEEASGNQVRPTRLSPHGSHERRAHSARPPRRRRRRAQDSAREPVTVEREYCR